MKLYMKCTTDSLELPLAVADSTRCKNASHDKWISCKRSE